MDAKGDRQLPEVNVEAELALLLLELSGALGF